MKKASALSGRPRRYSSADEFSAACESYIAQCASTGEPPIFPAWAAHMGLAGRTLRAYGKLSEFSEAYHRTKTKIEAALALRMFQPGAPLTAILACLNSGFAWRDPPPSDEPNIGDSFDDLLTRASLG